MDKKYNKKKQNDWDYEEKVDFALRAVISGRGEDAGATFPQSDAADFANGARFIPGQVTYARRRGENVRFVQQCGRCCWYWQFPDGSRIYHYDPLAASWIAEANGKTPDPATGRYVGGVGPCYHCGNPFTRGLHVSREGVEKGKYDDEMKKEDPWKHLTMEQFHRKYPAFYQRLSQEYSDERWSQFHFVGVLLENGKVKEAVLREEEGV